MRKAKRKFGLRRKPSVSRGRLFSRRIDRIEADLDAERDKGAECAMHAGAERNPFLESSRTGIADEAAGDDGEGKHTGLRFVHDLLRLERRFFCAGRLPRFGGRAVRVVDVFAAAATR